MPKATRLLLTLAGLLYLAAFTRDRGEDWINATVLPPVLAEISVEMRDRNGDLLRAFSVEDGIWRMRPGPVDPAFTDMLIRYEDKRFWSHAGVDPVAMVRAMAQTLWNGRTISGGSTLTMQVARLIEDGPTGRWNGKIRQIRVALALEQRLSKRQILNLYLTHAPYGGNLEGIRAGTRAWFGKDPARLTPAQAALLVALPQSPESRRPDRKPDAARAARNRVLQRMQRYNVLSASEMRSAATEAIPTRIRMFPRLAPHLTDQARRRHPEAKTHDLTLDAGLQARLEQLVAQAATRAGPRVSGALIVADHRSGEVLASVGSAGYQDARQGFVDMTRALRSPGSTLKPLIYGLAFDQGLAHPETLISDSPVMFGRYAPRNFDGVFRGDVRVRDALQMSLNIPVVRLTHELGPARVMAALRKAETAPDLSGGTPGLAISLGGVGLSLHDLVQLYATLAAGGQGPVLYHRALAQTAQTDRILSEPSAWQIGDILAGLTPPPGAPQRALAYKTGTSYGHRDAWAIGYDGQHVIGVWLGRADGTPVPGAFGGDLAAPLLFEAFGHLKPDFTPLRPPPPATLIVGAAQLPPPLQRFRPRTAAFQNDPMAPNLLFPPESALIEARGGPLTIKLRGGVGPFSVLADGVPVLTGQRHREFEIPNPGPGFASLVVVDARGLSDRVSVQIE
ncbi:penicillin-binding protein 1C [Rhodobacteraceae bacterium B1Z28]|uniref:peptidoglycan glycosyltransferase n=1 Tax=Ruegeria haliotis TaxID=2747601 RepID=A0ABX2PPL5_9RHOB|nr:penicillin-binding protein 1C [Ruegeria haliotis]NVO56096.1 penicillin-binding protein 1C [Ruegeria haliotis]